MPPWIRQIEKEKLGFSINEHCCKGGSSYCVKKWIHLGIGSINKATLVYYKLSASDYSIDKKKSYLHCMPL